MLVIDRHGNGIEDGVFSDMPDKIGYPVCIVRNITKVRKTRLFARRDTGALIEFLILDPYRTGEHEALVSKGGRLRMNEELHISGRAGIRIVSRKGEIFTVKVISDYSDDEVLEKYGHVPLPPYIKREDNASDIKNYQTVYARIPGSSAAPTAGLHFTKPILKRLDKKGALTADVLLHVGLGTFEPVRADNVEEHVMHSEYFELDENNAEILNNARQNDIPILAVGTTALRVLETVFDRHAGIYRKGKGNTDIFIHPPMTVKSADMLLTNFHLPKSTLLMLVSAFAGYEKIMEAYSHAVNEKYRFFSYGDCMLIR